MAPKSTSLSLDNVVDPQRKKSGITGGSGASAATGTTCTSSGSKSPSRKSKSSKTMASTATLHKVQTIVEEKQPHRSRPRVARRLSDDTMSFHQSDWNESEVDGFSPASDQEGLSSSHVFLVTPRKNAIQPVTRRVTQTEQEWFSEWEEMDEESTQVTKSSSAKKAKSKKKDAKRTSKKWALALDGEDTSSSCSQDGETQGTSPQHQGRKGLAKCRSKSNLCTSTTASKTSSRVKQSNAEEQGMDMSHRGKMSGSLSRKSKVDDDQNASNRRMKQLAKPIDDMDESRGGKKKSPSSYPEDSSLKERKRKDSNDDDLDISLRRPKEKLLSGPKSAAETSSKASSSKSSDPESLRLQKTKETARDDSKKATSRAPSTQDENIDTSRRGNSCRKSSGKDIVGRRTARRGIASGDGEEDVVEEKEAQKEKKESRLSALRRASIVAAAAIDDDGGRRGRGLSTDHDTVSSCRRSASVSRRASVTGDGRRGREAERYDDDGPRARSRSRRSVSRGRAPEKPQPKEKSMLGECKDSDQDDEDDEVERLFRKAHEDERKFMLDKSRVGPVRALERAGCDDEDGEPSSPGSPRQRKKSGYLPTNLNDTSNVQVPTATAPVAGRRKGDKKSTPRKQSLDDLLNFSGPAPGYLGSSISVGYSLAEPGSQFSSSASLPGEVLAKKGSTSADWTKNVDSLLDARRRSHMGDSPRSHKGQLQNVGSTPAAVVSASYANKMRQLQNTRAYSIGGAPSALGNSRSSRDVGKASNLILPMITASPETRKKLNPLGIRRPTMF